MNHVTLENFSPCVARNMRLLARSRNMALYELQNNVIGDFLAENSSEKIDYEVSCSTEKNRYNAFVDDHVLTMIRHRSSMDRRTNADVVLAALVSFARRHGLDSD
ncbi:hypothetical protein [Dickeya sp. NCPPB 3274]|uniref:hypothetical protein n=1 Tax=Dickeya sp. NCPPB 3274 TaxID=568766 RepID=UPI001267B0BD|nr:hypothetical protein [Dickeya sp. NCPPB 3274]